MNFNNDNHREYQGWAKCLLLLALLVQVFSFSGYNQKIIDQPGTEVSSELLVAENNTCKNLLSWKKAWCITAEKTPLFFPLAANFTNALSAYHRDSQLRYKHFTTLFIPQQKSGVFSLPKTIPTDVDDLPRLSA